MWAFAGPAFLLAAPVATGSVSLAWAWRLGARSNRLRAHRPDLPFFQVFLGCILGLGALLGFFLVQWHADFGETEISMRPLFATEARRYAYADVTAVMTSPWVHAKRRMVRGHACVVEFRDGHTWSTEEDTPPDWPSVCKDGVAALVARKASVAITQSAEPPRSDD